ncbi:MAG TPA: sulfite exporter TauE/SafE family protein [Syntrophorhabdaceae bacterium]|nr:sulfite exporter TauE/SafE family protein [Syntrophorhabdaceae bacterium]
MNNFKGLVTGLSGGFFGGLVGLGGGVIMVPLMVLWLKLNQLKAHGTSLIAVVFTGLIGATAYFYNGTVDEKVAVILATTATITARSGALFAHTLPEKKLKKAFGIFLVSISLLLLGKGYMFQTTFHTIWWLRVFIFLATGALTGFVSGMMGVGGGTIMIPPMVILTHMPQQMAQGTSLFAMVPVGLIGAYTHYKLGNVEKRIVPGLVIGAALGGLLGGTIANLIPEFYLRLLFSLMLIWMGIRFIRISA